MSKSALIFDGIPKSWSKFDFLTSLAQAYENVHSNNLSFPTEFVVAVVTPLGMGGWYVRYESEEDASLVLSASLKIHDPATHEPIDVDIHLAGSKSKKRVLVDDAMSRSVFVILDKDVLEFLSKHEPAELASPTTTIDPDLRGLLEKIPKDGDPKPRLLNKKGALAIEFSTITAASNALKYGITLSGFGMKLKCHPLRPKAEISMPYCNRCLAAGHSESQCKQRPRCRVCGNLGHAEVKGACPRKLTHPKHLSSTTDQPFCVQCHESGHKAGSSSCKQFRLTRQEFLQHKAWTAAGANARCIQRNALNTATPDPVTPSTPLRNSPAPPLVPSTASLTPADSIPNLLSDSNSSALVSEVSPSETLLKSLVYSISSLASFRPTSNSDQLIPKILDSLNLIVQLLIGHISSYNKPPPPPSLPIHSVPSTATTTTTTVSTTAASSKPDQSNSSRQKRGRDDDNESRSTVNNDKDEMFVDAEGTSTNKLKESSSEQMHVDNVQTTSIPDSPQEIIIGSANQYPPQ